MKACEPPIRAISAAAECYKSTLLCLCLAWGMATIYCIDGLIQILISARTQRLLTLVMWE